MPDNTLDEIARLQEEYEKNPEGRLFVHLAEAYRQVGELEKARGVLNEGLERHPEYLSARIVLAQVETQQGDGERAVEMWREVTRLDPDNELALRTLAELEYNRGNGESSLGYYRRLAALGVDDAELRDVISLLEAEAESAANSEDAGTGAPIAGILFEEAEAGVQDPNFSDGTNAARITASGAESGQMASSAVPGIRRAPLTQENATGLAEAIALSELFVRLLEHRDATFHSDGSLTRLLATVIGRELELDQTHMDEIVLAALLSGLGGLGIPSGGGNPLAEMAEIEGRQREVAISRTLLRGISLPARVVEGVAHQHERWDGDGYPDGLKEEEIPHVARVIAVARACATLLTREGGNGSVAAAMEEIERRTGSRFDPAVVSGLQSAFRNRARHGLGFGLGGRIVIACPDELRGLDVATQLHAEGYAVSMASDTRAARDHVHPSLPTAIVLGAGLPREDLIRLIRDIRSSAESSGIPLLIIDANDMELRVDLLTSGADVCFATDVTFRELKATLDALLRRREDIDRPHSRAPQADSRF